jgi:hypothetical protein
MPDLMERCGRQLRGECKGCKFDCLREKEENGKIVLYSFSNSQCDKGYERQTYQFA